jgi:hypothetical protein
VRRVLAASPCTHLLATPRVANLALSLQASNTSGGIKSVNPHIQVHAPASRHPHARTQSLPKRYQESSAIVHPLPRRRTTLQTAAAPEPHLASRTEGLIADLQTDLEASAPELEAAESELQELHGAIDAAYRAFFSVGELELEGGEKRMYEDVTEGMMQDLGRSEPAVCCPTGSFSTDPSCVAVAAAWESHFQKARIRTNLNVRPCH